MKFLIDAQLPKKLCQLFKWKGYDALHTLDLPNKNRTKDSEINQISIDQKRVLINKDLDFIESLLISKINHINLFMYLLEILNKRLLEIFVKNFDKIIEVIKTNRLIELTDTNIIVRD